MINAGPGILTRLVAPRISNVVLPEHNPAVADAVQLWLNSVAGAAVSRQLAKFLEQIA
jgi:hypothetical protein